MSKRLVIDAFKLVKGRGKSIGIYNLTHSLVEYLGAENCARGMENEIIVLGNDYNRSDFEVPGVQFHRCSGDPLDRKTYTLWELFGVTKVLKDLDPDRVLFPRGYRPLVYHGKDTILIHDLIPLWYREHHPDWVSKPENFYITNRLLASIRGADRVITISDYSRDDIERRVPGSKKKTVRIYNGLNDVVLPEDTAVHDPALQEGYIAAVTSSLPHKNAAGILKSYGIYYERAKKEGVTPLSLLVIGIDDLAPYREQAGLSSEAASHVILKGFVKEHSELCVLIKNAKIFLFLSYIEGFGFPPLEAMQLDTPVVSSDRTSLKEVIGDAGLLVDPDNCPDVADKLLYLQTHEKLCAELVQKGEKNITRFGWDSRVPLYWNELFR